MQIRQILASSEPDTSMYGALPPGAWWEVANSGTMPPLQPYADKAGNAAVQVRREAAFAPFGVCSQVKLIISRLQLGVEWGAGGCPTPPCTGHPGSLRLPEAPLPPCP